MKGPHPGTYLERGMLLHLERKGLLPEPDEDGVVVLEGPQVSAALGAYVGAYMRRTLQVAAVLQHQRHEHPALQPPDGWGP